MVEDVAFPGPFALSSLGDVVHATYVGDSDWLVAVQFHFEEGYLSVEVDPDDDTVDVSFDALWPPPLRHWSTDSARHTASASYADVLGLSSSWRWVLRNQQGYQDAFQIELGPSTSTVTLQYLAMASHLEFRRVTRVLSGRRTV